MNMQEENISGIEGLQVIQSMINKAKNQFSESGHLYLLWGWVVFVCSIAQFIMLHYFRYEYHYLVWLTTWLAFIYQFIYLSRQKKKTRVKTYTDDILSFVWITFVIMMFLFGVLYGRLLGDEYYRFISPGFLALYGMPTFLSGIILRFRPLLLGGIFCWLLSITATFIRPDYQLLLLTLAVVVAWIIPGYILQARYKKSKP
jgi:hypothetical protein